MADTETTRLPANANGLRCGHNYPPDVCPYDGCGYRDALDALAAERERCAKIAEESESNFSCYENAEATGASMACEYIAAAIRSGRSTLPICHHIFAVLGCTHCDGIHQCDGETVRLISEPAKGGHFWEIVTMSSGQAMRCSVCLCAYDFGHDIPCPGSGK